MSTAVNTSHLKDVNPLCGTLSDFINLIRQFQKVMGVPRKLESLSRLPSFQVHLFRNINRTMLRNNIVGCSKEVLEYTFAVSEVPLIRELFESIGDESSISIISLVYNSEEVTFVVATSLYAMSEEGCYISYIAVIERDVVGVTEDGLFWNCGIASFFICIIQLVTFVNYNSWHVYCWSNNQMKKKDVWYRLGFSELHLVNNAYWPKQIEDFACLFHLPHEHAIESKLTPKGIFSSITNFDVSINRQSSLDPYCYNHVLSLRYYEDSWFDYTALLEMLHFDDQRRICLQRFKEAVDCTGVDKDCPVYARKIHYIFYNRLEIMKDALSESGGNGTLKEISDMEGYISEVALDYCMMLMFFHVPNIFPIFTKVFNCWNDNLDFSKMDDHFRQNYKYTDCDIMKENANNKEYNFIIPFFQGVHFCTIVRRWIGDSLYFFYIDSSYKTERNVASRSTRFIHYEVFAFLMNSPLWPVDVTSRWVRVPSKEQEGSECGFRTILHAYILVTSDNPLTCLLPLNYVGSTVLKKKDHPLYQFRNSSLPLLCRTWIKNMMYNKKWEIPEWIKSVVNFRGGKTKVVIKPRFYLELHCTAKYETEVKDIVWNERTREIEDREAENKRKIALLKGKTSFFTSRDTLQEDHQPLTRKVLQMGRYAGTPSCRATSKISPSHVSVQAKRPRTRSPVEKISMSCHAQAGNVFEMDIHHNFSEKNDTNVNSHMNVSLLDIIEHVIVKSGEGVGERMTLCSPWNPSTEYGDNLSSGESSSLSLGVPPWRDYCSASIQENFRDIMPPLKKIEIRTAHIVLTRNFSESSDTSSLDNVFSSLCNSSSGDGDNGNDDEELINSHGSSGGSSSISMGVPPWRDYCSAPVQEDIREVILPLKKIVIRTRQTVLTRNLSDSIDMSSVSITMNKEVKDNVEHFFAAEHQPPLFRTNKKQKNKPMRGSSPPVYINDYCPVCLRLVNKAFICSQCSNPTHNLCGFLKPNGEFFCSHCFTLEIETAASPSVRRIRYATKKDSELSKLWNDKSSTRRPTSEKLSSRAARLPPLSKEQRTQMFNLWLTEITHLLCKPLGKKKFKFYGCHTDFKNVQVIYSTYLMDTLFENDKELLEQLCLEVNQNKWCPIPGALMNLIRARGECFSNKCRFESFDKLERQMWSFMKLCTYNNEQPTDDFLLVDLEKDFKSKTYHVSMADSGRTTFVNFVPKYFLYRWQRFCEKYKSSDQVNDFENLLKKAKDNANRWVRMDAGRPNYCTPTIEMKQNPMNLPTIYKKQSVGESSCVFSSLISALHFINDHFSRDLLMEKVKSSLNYSSLAEESTINREAFAAKLLNRDAKYKNIVLKEFNILEKRSMWPTLCILKGSDDNVTHAITVVDGYIFDSSCDFAMHLDRKNLDWCCGSDHEEVRFVSVQCAYRFVKLKGPTSIFIRNKDEIDISINSFVNLFKCVGDYRMCEVIEKYKAGYTMEDDFFAVIAQNICEKTRYYKLRKVRERTLLDLMKTNISEPMALVLTSNAENYKVITMYDKVFFDGSKNPGFIFSEVYLKKVLRWENTCFNNISVHKGYVFERMNRK